MKAVTSALPLMAALLLQQQGFFGQVVSNPTGNNGYEEYVRAAELASTPSVKAFLSWQPGFDYSEYFRTAKGPEVVALQAFAGKTPLQGKRILLRENGRILDLVRMGNMKPVTNPRTVTNGHTRFPELSGMRSVARVSVACSDALLADGRSAEAARVMSDAMEMSANMQQGILISYLSGVACQAQVLSGIYNQLDRYSEPDWKRFAAITTKLLDKPNPLHGIMRGEADMIMNTLRDVAKDKKLGEAVAMTSDNPAFAARMKGMSEAELGAAVRELEQELSAWLADTDTMLRQGESKWRSQTRPKAVTDGERLFELMMPVTDTSYVAETRIRTQLRLLRLHALLQIYRWNWNELPSSLDQVATRAEQYDPLTETPFRFERTEAGYRLYSKGSEATGEIELRYRRQSSGGRSTEPPAMAFDYSRIIADAVFSGTGKS